MTQFLIGIDSGAGCHWERRDTPEGRDECIRQVSLVHPGWRIGWYELPDELLPIFTLTMREAMPPRDPGRGL